MLVVLMIVYHAAYVIQSTSHELYLSILSQLAFLHSAFLFVSGYLVGYHYSGKETSVSQRRLFNRGCKIMLVFIICNLFAWSIGITPPLSVMAESFDSMSRVLVNFVLSVSGELFAFEILVYIAIYLWLSSRTVALKRSSSLVGCFVTAVILSTLVDSRTLEFLSVGLFGQLVGTIVRDLDTTAIAEKFETIVIRFGLAVHVLARPIFHYAHHTVHGGARVLVLVADTLLWWAATWSLLSLVNHAGLNKVIRLLGKHTLVAYLVQMPVVRICALLCDASSSAGAMTYAIVVVIVFAATLITVACVDNLQVRSSRFSTAYRFVFG